MIQPCVVCVHTLNPSDHVVFEKDGYPIARCPTCGLMFRSTLPTLAELTSIYSEAYFASAVEPSDGYADYIADERFHRDVARRRLDGLETAAGGSHGRLLDVGAAAGFFVSEATTRGWDAEGIDVAPAMVAWGRERLGERLHLGTVSTVSDLDSFRAITMWDFIEHSLDPAADLAHSFDLLQAGGLLAVSTGDIESATARLSRSRWHLLTPRHHNFFFSARTLTMLLTRLGFKTVVVGHPGARYSIEHIAYKFDRMLRLSAVHWATSRIAKSKIGRAGIPLNLFDIVTVVAQKPVESKLAAPS